jgi:ribose transport system ATP-binding protein
MTETCPLLELRSISKNFPGVRALSGVSLSLHAGEVLGIVGENGAGKSTLLKILGGLLRPDEGEIRIDDKRHHFSSACDANPLGIRLIHQELNLANELNVAENIFLGRQPSRGPRWFRMTNARALHARAAALLKIVGLNVSSYAIVGRLSIGQRQLVEIAKALSDDARILVFDEPTSSLSLNETNRLLALVEQLRDRGVAIIYVTHRLNEVARLANRVSVLRDGQHVGTLTDSDITPINMMTLMVGREVAQFYARRSRTIFDGAPLLEVRNLRCGNAECPVSFSIRAGEIVGLAGLVGAGRTELARALFGIEPILQGEIRIDSKPVRIRNPLDAMAAGLALVPEDRKELGLVARMPVGFNIALPSLPRLARFGWYNRIAETEMAEHYKRTLNIRTSNLHRSGNLLSGGNQQKVVLAKWLATRPKVLILDEPTRGIDINAKSEIYRLIFELAANGMAILMISSEMDEIIGVADRVIVMRQGRIVGELADNQIAESSVMALALGPCNGTTRT